MIKWDNSDKERVHDYIQWLFPTYQRSQFNSNAPELDGRLVAQMKANPKVMQNMKKAFESILNFYGLHYNDSTNTVERTSEFLGRVASWGTPNNHNLLRITRILDSLKIFGLDDQAKAFFNELTDIKREYSISENTYSYWNNAVDKVYH